MKEDERLHRVRKKESPSEMTVDKTELQCLQISLPTLEDLRHQAPNQQVRRRVKQIAYSLRNLIPIQKKNEVHLIMDQLTKDELRHQEQPMTNMTPAGPQTDMVIILEDIIRLQKDPTHHQRDLIHPQKELTLFQKDPIHPRTGHYPLIQEHTQRPTDQIRHLKKGLHMVVTIIKNIRYALPSGVFLIRCLHQHYS